MKTSKQLKILVITTIAISIGILIWSNFLVTEIIKVPCEFKVYNLKPDKWYVFERFVIVNPPEDLHKLRALIAQYDKKYPMDMQAAQEAVDKQKEAYTKEDSKNRKIEYARIFYPKTLETPKNWDGEYVKHDGPYYSEIAEIKWQEDSIRKEYTCSLLKEGRTVKYIVFYPDGKTEEVQDKENSIIDQERRYLDNWY